MTVQVAGSDNCGQSPCSGVNAIWYSLSGAQTQAWTQVGVNVPNLFTNIQVVTDGLTTVSYYVVDRAGNINLHVLGTYEDPRVRLPGAYGSAMLLNFSGVDQFVIVNNPGVSAVRASDGAVLWHTLVVPPSQRRSRIRQE